MSIYQRPQSTAPFSSGGQVLGNGDVPLWATSSDFRDFETEVDRESRPMVHLAQASLPAATAKSQAGLAGKVAAFRDWAKKEYGLTDAEARYYEAQGWEYIRQHPLDAASMVVGASPNVTPRKDGVYRRVIESVDDPKMRQRAYDLYEQSFRDHRLKRAEGTGQKR